MIKVKLCGILRPCEIQWANEELPDYVGFVFAGEKRRIEDKTAGILRQMLNPHIPGVGVFVNETLEHIQQLVQLGTIQWVQLHGQEDEMYIKRLRQHSKVPIIQAFSIESAADVQKACQSSADYVLFDHGRGGTGQCFDWTLIENIKRPFFLAGGICTANVEKARHLHPFALDVSSGVEIQGCKDRDKIRQFIRQVHCGTAQ